MGNWRERPRRTFRTQKPPWSAIRNYDRDPPIEYWRDGIPLWEKKFCTKIGCVPWGKIVDSKNFINCHTNIVNWNDSACEEALDNAKRRYWAEINGHQCDIYPPDPDKYIENIDWSPDIDSEMIEELDLAYCAPNITRSDDWLECKNKRTRNLSSVTAEGHITDPAHVGNPWVHSNQLIENTGQGLSRWNLSDSGKANNDGNPWDSSVAQVNTGMVDSAWKDKAPEVVTSWKKEEFASDARGGLVDNAWRDRAHQGGVTSWKTEGNASDSRGMVDNAWRDEVHQGGTASWKAKGVASDARNNAWSRHQLNASNYDHYNRPGNNSYNRNVRNLTDRTRSSIQVNKQDWKYQYRYGKRPKDAEFGNVGW